jgi:glycerol-3-phosphate dehydrogenase
LSRYDLLIIGGGINGLGIAADAGARGLSVLLAEKGDFGGGTTSASSRLIHGGLRYLRYGQVDLVRESLRERGILTRQRPHLVRPIRLLIPAFRTLPPPGWVVGAGLLLYDLLAHDPLFPRSRKLSPGETREHEPGLIGDELTGGFLYPDAQVEFPERLCIELMREALDAGGEARNHTRVVALRQRDGHVQGAALRDELTGKEWEVDAGLVINAAGPWVDAVNRLLTGSGRPPVPRLIGGTWGTHLVLPARPEGPRGPLYATARKDGRPFFLLPWDGRLLVGTTDVPFEGDPDALLIQEWELDYLLAETNRLFPGCRYQASEIQWTTIGVRPLPASDRDAGAITRRHFLVDHGRQHGIRGLGSVVGGKLTTYRSLAEVVVDWAVRSLPPSASAAPCSTRSPGEALSLEEMQRQAAEAARGLGLGEQAAQRLVRLYGPRYAEVLEYVARQPGLGRSLGSGTAALEAEVVHAVEREGARTVEDILLRRLMLLPPTDADREAVRRVCKEQSLKV